MNFEKIKKQIPNAITWSRVLLMIPTLISFIMANYPLTLGLFTTATVTDKLDGSLARKLNCTSDFGAKLDAFCDKALALLGSIMTISLSGPMYLIPLSFEGAIGGYNLYRNKKGEEVHTTIIGKIKTVLLYITMILGIASKVFNINPAFLISSIAATSALQTLTLGSYVKDSKEQQKVSKKELFKTNIISNSDLGLEKKRVRSIKNLKENSKAKVLNNHQTLFYNDSNISSDFKSSNKPKIRKRK